MVTKKKTVMGLLTGLCCMSLTISAFAATTASKAAGNYGTLSGSVSATKSVLDADTYITKNPDKAVVTLKADLINSAGTTVYTTGVFKSTGTTDTTCGCTLSKTPSDYTFSSVYAAHGVQGGTSNPAYAVYTNTKI